MKCQYASLINRFLIETVHLQYPFINDQQRMTLRATYESSSNKLLNNELKENIMAFQ